MRCGLVIYGTLETLSGGYLYDRQLVDYLRRQGDEVEIISLPWRGYGRHLLHNLSTDLYQTLRDGSFDILLQDELNHPSLFWLNGRLNPRPFPILSIVHHLRSSEKRPSWQNRFYRWIELRYLCSVDGFIFNSETTRQVAERLAGAGWPFVVAYPAGDRFGQRFNEAAIRKRALQSGPLRILFVANLIPRKGLDTLLEAIALLPSGTWRLDVAGSTTADAPYTRRIQHLVQKAALSNFVKLHGLLSGEALINLLKASHVLVVPSSYEGFGIVYLEAMGFGLPAVATTSGAAGEIITNDHNGFLICEGDSAALAQRIGLLSGDRERLAQMGTAALARYQAHPTWEQTAASIRHFLQTFNDGQNQSLYPLPFSQEKRR